MAVSPDSLVTDVSRDQRNRVSEAFSTCRLPSGEPGFVLRRLIQDESLTSADLVADLRPMLTGLRQG